MRKGEEEEKEEGENVEEDEWVKKGREGEERGGWNIEVEDEKRKKE